jgi:hypothetical protein
VKLNIDLDLSIATTTKKLFKEYKDVFTWSYKDFKGMPPHIAQHWIELDIIILHFHHNRYLMNPKYVVVVKQDQDKLLIAGFITLVEKTTWLLPIVVVLKKNGKLHIYINFKKLNVATKKDPYLIFRGGLGYGNWA